MSVVRKVATRQNGGDPIEVDLGAEAVNVRMPDGEALPTAFEPPLKRAEQKESPAEADTLALTDSAGGHPTRRLTFAALKAWLKSAFDVSYLGKDGDGGGLKPAFAESASRANIYNGLTLGVILGRVQKFFSDLKPVAFSGSYADLVNKPATMPPSAHGASHRKGGTDALTPADIGALSESARGTAGGVAPLGGDLKIPKEYLQTTEDALAFGVAGGEAGKFDRLTTPPTAATPLRYNGYLWATRMYGAYFSDNADYAEAYQIKGKAEPGDLIAIGPKGVLQCNNKVFNACVIGFVSKAPASVIGGKGIPIALAGRVPVKVIGPVCAGDFLAAAATPGAVLATEAGHCPRGSIVAMSLEDKPGDELGQVLAFILRL